MPGEERALQQFADIVAEKIVDAQAGGRAS